MAHQLNLQTFRSKTDEFADFLRNSGDNSVHSTSDSNSDQLLLGCVLAFEAKANQIVADHADVANFSNEEFDAYMGRLRAELSVTEAESASINDEIESLAKSYMEGTCQLESDLQTLRLIVESGESKGYWLDETREQAGKHLENEDYQKLAKPQYEDSFEILKLNHQIEENKVILKSLQDLDTKLKGVEDIEKIQEALIGLKVIDVEGNVIRVSLTTYIPDIEMLTSTKPFEVNHELLMEVDYEIMEIKHVEMFPNDVYIGEIVEAANTFSKLLWGLPEIRFSFEWFLQKVQYKIVLCTLRRHMVKIANNSRHSFELLDKDESIIAHMTCGIDAYLKPSLGWPLSSSGLKLVSLRSSDHNAEEISLNMLSEVEEAVNSADFDARKSITDFVEGIEEILLEKMCRQL